MSSVLDILMPIEEGRYIPQKVLESITNQGIPFRLWISTRFSDGNYADARNNIKQYGGSDVILMLDNDIVLPPNAIPKMIDFLRANPNYAAIAICKHNAGYSKPEEFLHAQHVDMSCVMFRKAVLDKITFFDRAKGERWIPTGGNCECTYCCWDIRQMGLEIGFLPYLHAEHILNTSRT